MKFGDDKLDTLPQLLPRVRGALRLQRRVPEAPLHPHPGRRGRTELPVPGYKRFFTPRRPVHGRDGGVCSVAGRPASEAIMAVIAGTSNRTCGRPRKPTSRARAAAVGRLEAAASRTASAADCRDETPSPSTVGRPLFSRGTASRRHTRHRRRPSIPGLSKPETDGDGEG